MLNFKYADKIILFKKSKKKETRLEKKVIKKIMKIKKTEGSKIT